MIREFKPALLFLGKFLAIYFIGNILYGLFIESYGEVPDPITFSVTNQTGKTLQLLGYDALVEKNEMRPTVFVKTSDKVVISVFEGCNGVNVVIVFLAFIAAFGGDLKKMVWFVPLGILIIHLFNLSRIGLLYHMSLFQSRYFYYFHKYLFTATLYMVVFALWALWVMQYHGKSKTA